MREIGFSINNDEAIPSNDTVGSHTTIHSNGEQPSAIGLAPYLVLRLIVSGLPDQTTGYLVNAQTLDAILRKRAIPAAAQQFTQLGTSLTGDHLLRSILDEVRPHVPDPCRFESLTLWTTPQRSYSINAGDPSMVELTHSFEFSASHRLHIPSMSEEENRRIFGKCNNPRGHGHNYRVDISICREIPEPTGQILPLRLFETIVQEKVIDRFDHTHINEEVPDFKSLNPSVENIARVIWDLLWKPLSPAILRRVRVWETAKTYAEYVGAPSPA